MEEGELFDEIIEEMPSTSAEARALQSDAPSTPVRTPSACARTPRRAGKRKHEEDDMQNKFLEIAKMQADSFKVIFETNNNIFHSYLLYTYVFRCLPKQVWPMSNPTGFWRKV